MYHIDQYVIDVRRLLLTCWRYTYIIWIHVSRSMLKYIAYIDTAFQYENCNELFDWLD